MTEQTSLLPAEDPDQLVAQAVDEHAPVARYCLFSGGGDSAVLAHRCRDAYEQLAFIDTGTALPGVVDHVERFAAWLDKPLRIERHDLDEYEAMVVGTPAFRDAFAKAVAVRDAERAEDEARLAAFRRGVDIGQPPRVRPPLTVAELTRGDKWRGALNPPPGFPGPAQHGRAYNRLKERLIEAVLRDAKVDHPRSARVLFLTGVRRAESQRRRARAAITRKGGAVFVNPLIDWTDREMRDYRERHDFPISDVAALIHRSGECNCGAFAAPGEREMLRSLWPTWFEERIASLEREAVAAGIPACRWGERPPADGKTVVEGGPLCNSCTLRQMELGGVDKAQASA